VILPQAGTEKETATDLPELFASTDLVNKNT
jgi:hypothetical protein